MSDYNFKNPLGTIKNRNNHELQIKVFDYDVQEPLLKTDEKGEEILVPQVILIYSYNHKFYQDKLNVVDLDQTLPHQEPQKWNDIYVLTVDKYAFFIDDMVEYATFQ